jgi:hypothetical protein
MRPHEATEGQEGQEGQEASASQRTRHHHEIAKADLTHVSQGHRHACI